MSFEVFGFNLFLDYHFCLPIRNHSLFFLFLFFCVFIFYTYSYIYTSINLWTYFHEWPIWFRFNLNTLSIVSILIINLGNNETSDRKRNLNKVKFTLFFFILNFKFLLLIKIAKTGLAYKYVFGITEFQSEV